MNAIVFDLDGTLLELTREYDALLAESFRAVEGESRQEWIDTYTETFFESFAACEPAPYRQAFAAVSENPDALTDALHEQEIDAVRPPENARSHLAGLAEEYALGVLTNGVREWQVAKLTAHDLATYFDAVVASYEVGAHKPDSEPFALLEDRLPAENYAMVGDADGDIDGARDVGWTAYRYAGDGFGGLSAALEWD